MQIICNYYQISISQTHGFLLINSEDFFNVAAFPHIKFVSTSVKELGESFVVEGELTIKDVTKPLTIEFAYTGVIPK